MGLTDQDRLAMRRGYALLELPEWIHVVDEIIEQRKNSCYNSYKPIEQRLEEAKQALVEGLEPIRRMVRR